MCRRYKITYDDNRCSRDAHIRCAAEDRVIPYERLRRHSPPCDQEWNQGVQRISIPMPCHKHLSKDSGLQKAACNYDRAIRDTKCDLGDGSQPVPKVEMLHRDVRARVNQFKNACLEDLFLWYEGVVNDFITGGGPERTAITAAVEACRTKIKLATNVYKDDTLFQFHTPPRGQPDDVYHLFWLWEFTNRTYPFTTGQH